MKSLITLAVALAVAASGPAAAQRNIPPGADLAKESAVPHSERMRAGIELRMQRADENFATMKMQKSATSRASALVSLSKRIDLGEANAILTRCAADVHQLHRTVGEMQLAYPATTPLLQDHAFAQQLHDDYVSFLEFRLNSLDADRRSIQPDEKERLWWHGQEYSAISKALAEARTQPVRFNGLLVSGSVDAIECVATAPELATLAVEPVAGSRRPFAIPLETYR